MPEKTKIKVSVSIDRENREGIDRLAEREDRDRSYLINQAVGSYLAKRRWEEAHIKESLGQAKAGKFATGKQVEAAYSAFGRPRMA